MYFVSITDLTKCEKNVFACNLKFFLAFVFTYFCRRQYSCRARQILPLKTNKKKTPSKVAYFTAQIFSVYISNRPKISPNLCSIKMAPGMTSIHILTLRRHIEIQKAAMVTQRDETMLLFLL